VAASRLEQLVRRGAFRSRRHHELLRGPAVPWGELAALQGRYAGASSDPERRAIGVEFERAVRSMQDEQEQSDEEAARAAEFAAIFSAPPKVVNVARSRAASERWVRALLEEMHRKNGWALAAIAERVGVSVSVVRRDLAMLECWRAPSG
jgi:hypothetical protein